MMPRRRPIQRPRDARLLAVDAQGRIIDAARSRLVDFLRPGDLVIANDAAVLPASLRGTHVATGAEIEVRLAGRASLDPKDVRLFSAIVFGTGDFRVRTEERPLPPPLAAGDRVGLGPLSATIDALLDHPRLVRLRFDGCPDAIWAGLAHHGRPIQYASPRRAQLWDVWTRMPASPWPRAASASFTGLGIDRRDAGEADRVRDNHACGGHLFYRRSRARSALAVRRDLSYFRGDSLSHPAREGQGGRVVAIGRPWFRALEHAAAPRCLIGGGGGRPAVGRRPAICGGRHRVGHARADSSHYHLLRAFAE